MSWLKKAFFGSPTAETPSPTYPGYNLYLPLNVEEGTTNIFVQVDVGVYRARSSHNERSPGVHFRMTNQLESVFPDITAYLPWGAEVRGEIIGDWVVVKGRFGEVPPQMLLQGRQFWERFSGEFRSSSMNSPSRSAGIDPIPNAPLAGNSGTGPTITMLSDVAAVQPINRDAIVPAVAPWSSSEGGTLQITGTDGNELGAIAQSGASSSSSFNQLGRPRLVGPAQDDVQRMQPSLVFAAATPIQGGRRLVAEQFSMVSKGGYIPPNEQEKRSRSPTPPGESRIQRRMPGSSQAAVQAEMEELRRQLYQASEKVRLSDVASLRAREAAEFTQQQAAEFTSEFTSREEITAAAIIAAN